MAVGNPISLTNNVASRIISQIATESQTNFTISGGYRINAISVYRNGVRLVSGRDYNAVDGSSVVLLSPSIASDSLEFHIFDDFRVADAIVSNASQQNIEGNLTISGILTASNLIGSNLQLESLTVTNDVSIGGTLTYQDVNNIDSVGIITARTDLHVGAGLSVVGVSTLTSLEVTGTSTFNGNIDLGNAVTDTITATGRFDSDLIPSSDDQKDLGSSTLEWRNLYLDGTANIDTLSVSGNANIAGVVTATTFDGNLATTNLTGNVTNAQLDNSSVSFGGVSVTLGSSDTTPAFNLSDATNYPTTSLSGTITNAQLDNSSVSYGGVSLSLGGSDATPAFNLSDATNYPTSSLSGTITNAQLAGSIADDKLASTFLKNVVEDTTPQLGGNLDLNNNDITGTGNVDVTGNITSSGTVEAQNITVVNNLTVNGTVTTLDTVVTEVDRLEVAANNTTVGVAITQSGSGDILNLYDGSNSVFRVLDGGNVKIGPAGNPGFGAGSGLEVERAGSATIRIEDTSSSSSFEIQNTSGVIKQRLYNNQPWTIEYGSGEKVRITSAGLVGIGQTNPQGDLHIGSISGSKNIIMHSANQGNARIRFREGGSTTSGFNEYSIGMVGLDNALTVEGQGSGEIIRIMGDTGYIGIGTENPQTKLELFTNDDTDIQGDGGTNNQNSILRLFNKNGTDNTGVNNYVGIRFDVSNGATSSAWLNYVRTGNNQGAFLFKARNAASSYPELMRITSDGNVSINTTYPRARLDLRQASGHPAFNIGFPDDSFYRNLGTVGPDSSDGSTGQYLHVRLRTVWNDSSMTMFRVTGYYPYSVYGESYVGMYRYGNNSYRNSPYGQVISNQGNKAIINSVYNTTANPGYLVIVCDWNTTYNGLMIEHYGAGGAYGSYMQHDLEIIDTKRSTNTSAQW